MFPFPVTLFHLSHRFSHVCLQNQIDPAIKPEIMLKTPTTTMWFLRIAWRILEEKQKAKSKTKKRKRKKSESVFFVLGSRYCPHSVGVTCIDRRQTSADRRERRRRVERRRGNKVERNETGISSSEVTVHFSSILLLLFLCFISCAIERRKDHLKNSGFVVFHSCCCTPFYLFAVLYPTWVCISRICILSVIGPTTKKTEKKTQIKCSKRSKQKCQMSKRVNQKKVNKNS